MAQLITVTTGNYTNKDAISNTIRYITRTRINEDRKHELVSYGSPNVTCFGGEEAIERAIKEFKDIQRYYSKTEGRKVHHETLNLTDEEAKSFINGAQIDAFALDCSRVFDKQGYQVIYAAHYSNKYRLHVHFIVNSVNYRTGNKYLLYS